MKRLTLIAALAATTQLSGCFFFFIPLGLIKSALVTKPAPAPIRGNPVSAPEMADQP